MSQNSPENPAQPPANPPARPDGIAENEWADLGDAGKQALVRERTARADVERQLAAARARPTPPPGAPVAPAAAPAPAPVAPAAPATPGAQPDIAALIQQAVTAAVSPLQERLQSYETTTAATRIRDAVQGAAADRFHDPADAFAQIDPTAIVDANGQPDPAKITAELDRIATAKPYLAKPVDGRRFAAAPLAAGGATPGATPGGATPPIKEQVTDVLRQMQGHTGIQLLPKN